LRREIKNNGWKNAKEREERLIGGRQFGLELSAVALFMMLEMITVPLLIPVEALGTAAEHYCDRNGQRSQDAVVWLWRQWQNLLTCASAAFRFWIYVVQPD